MRNLFKKSLTLCLVAILAFSCFAGIVSAETAYTATIAVVDQTITPGTTSVDVVLNITSSQIGINEALIEVSSDIGTINSKATLDEATAAIASIELPEGSTNYGSFYLSAKNDISGETGETTVLGSIATASITVTFTVDENKAVGTYPINIKVDGVRAASSDEDVITFTYATANVTIEEAAPEHVHNWKMDYSVVDSSCVTKRICQDADCAEEEVISTIASAGTGHTGIRIYRAPVLEAGLAIAFRVLTTATEGYTDIYGDFVKTVYADDGSDTEIAPAEITLTGYHDDVYGDARYTFKYEGISSKEMCSNINIKIYGTNSEGYVCFLGTLDYALSNYVVGNYNKAGYEAVSPLLADLAFYGSAAQDYFNYHVSTKPVIATHTELPTEFNTTDVPTGVTISKAPDLANKVLINFRFDKSAVADYADTVTFEVDYIDGFGNPQTFVRTFSEFENYNDTRYNITFDCLESNHINDVITARIMDGETVLGSLEYTLEKYAYNRYISENNGGKLGVLTQALVNYGRTAATYFASVN